MEATGWKVIFLAGSLDGGTEGPWAQFPAGSRPSSCVVPDLISAEPTSYTTHTHIHTYTTCYSCPHVNTNTSQHLQTDSYTHTRSVQEHVLYTWSPNGVLAVQIRLLLERRRDRSRGNAADRFWPHKRKTVIRNRAKW